MTAFNALIVGPVDNVPCPRLVGRDTEMHDLMILFSTLGGIAAFGPMGFIIGPILAAVFVTSEIFGTAFEDVIPVAQPDRADRRQGAVAGHAGHRHVVRTRARSVATCGGPSPP